MAGAGGIGLKALARDDDIDQHYVQGRQLGVGSFGVTVYFTSVNDPTRHYAMKEQRKNVEDEEEEGAPEGTPPGTPHGTPEEEAPEGVSPEGVLRRLYREIVILKRILPKHPHIVELVEVLISPKLVFIVQELCEGRDMARFFLVADIVSGRRAFAQLVDAVHVLHQHGVIHGDIKADNILFKDRDFMQLKLIDFGCSSYKPDLAVEVNNDFDHTTWFTQDELEEEIPKANSPVKDTQALGKILHGILSGKSVPYLTDIEYRLQTDYKPRAELFGEAAMDLLSRIGEKPFGPDNPEEILTLDQIRAHPWLTGAPFWRQVEPIGQLLTELRTNFTVLKRLLKDWMVVRMTVLRNDQPLTLYYTIRGPLRRGTGESRVLEIEDISSTGTKMAMKVTYPRGYVRPQFAPGGFETKPPLQLYMEMLITLRILPPHEHIVTNLCVYLNEAFVAIVRELMEGSSLEEFFRLSACITESRMIFKQLANTVHFLHLHGVVHMDLHPHHIVFKSRNETPEFSWKILDFTQARFLPEMAQQTHEKFQPRRYLPPEMYMYDQGSTLVQIDITALGRILHAMMAGRWEPDPARRANLLPRSEIFGDAATNLLSMIGPEPFGPPPGNRNYTMDEICHHPWLQQVQRE